MNELELFRAPTGEPAGPDWNRIKTDFEAGAPSVREIAAREGVSDTAIRKRAKAEGWNASSRQGSQQVRPPCEPPARTTCESVVRTFAQAGPEDDGFKWELDNPDVVVINTPSFAVYVNPFDKIVIRTDSHGDDDPFVCIDPRDVPALIERLRKLTGAAR